jgi:hypothetical protein
VLLSVKMYSILLVLPPLLQTFYISLLLLFCWVNVYNVIIIAKIHNYCIRFTSVVFKTIHGHNYLMSTAFYPVPWDFKKIYFDLEIYVLTSLLSQTLSSQCIYQCVLLNKPGFLGYLTHTHLNLFFILICFPSTHFPCMAVASFLHIRVRKITYVLVLREWMPLI